MSSSTSSRPLSTSFAGLPVSKVPIHSRHIDAGHNLRLQITDYDGSGNFFLLFDLKTALFGENERAWLVEHFLRVVDAFIADHQRSLGSFSLLSEAERQKLLLDFNDTDAPYPVEPDGGAAFRRAGRTHAEAASPPLKGIYRSPTAS